MKTMQPKVINHQVIQHTIPSYLNVGIVKIHHYLSYDISIKCPLTLPVCSYGHCFHCFQVWYPTVPDSDGTVQTDDYW